MGVTVGGVSLDSLVWNVRTIGGRLATAGRKGANAELAGLDGTMWRSKPLAELQLPLSMWIVGSNTDGTVPQDGSVRSKMRDRYRQLLQIMGQQQGLVEVVDVARQVRCFAEIQGAVTPVTMAGGTRAEVEFPLIVPAGCWEDVAAFATAKVTLPASGSVTLTGAGGGNLPLLGLTVTLTPPGRNVRLVAADGSWLQFNGDLPAGADTVITLGGWSPDAKQVGSNTSLQGQLRWGPRAQPLPVPVPSSGDPVLTVTSEAGTTASKISISGRRRWQSA